MALTGVCFGKVMNLFSILPAVIYFLLSPLGWPGSFVGECLAVLDGDTIDVSRDGGRVRIRLEGVDCPERNQPFAEEAKAFTAKLVSGKALNIVEKEKDNYGRTVARVFVNGSDVSVELLRAGLARQAGKYNSDWLLAALEEQARRDRVGMWALKAAAESAVPNPKIGSEVASQDTGSKVIFHGNVNSRIFHSPACSAYRCRNCTLAFDSRDDAIAAGFRPCRMCDP